MLIIQTQSELKLHLKSFSKNKKIGFVPTMGALHAGHVSLIEKSFKENDITVVSIFVNPTQFNNPKDLEKYPRNLSQDTEKIKTVSDKIVIYAPDVKDVYQSNTVSEKYDFDGLEFQMEGKFRPGHFDGVGTVIKKLFEIVTPTNAYFGEKDFQQLQIIKKFVTKNNFPVHIIMCPIFREKNGLAMSSRNERLLPQEREKASIIYKTLQEIKAKFTKKSPKELEKFVEKVFEKNQNFKLEYFQIADEATLIPCIRKSKTKKYRAFIAVFVNEIRLIDTISLN